MLLFALGYSRFSIVYAAVFVVLSAVIDDLKRWERIRGFNRFLKMELMRAMKGTLQRDR